MRNNSFFKIILIAIPVVFFASCDKDFNSIGGDLVGDEHFGLEAKNYDVLSYNQKINPVQSNNLPINALGIYDDPVFGTTEASFATQVVLASVNPTVGNNVEMDSVTLSIPYFSHIDTDVPIAANGDNTYILDSIYGNKDGKINLSVYENGYFMRDLDPATGFLEAQKFYTNQQSDFENLKGTDLLNDAADVTQNSAFLFSNKEFKVVTPAETTGGTATITRTPPAMRLALNKTYFKTAIIDAAASGKLITNDVFKNHFRGLYFKVEKSGSNPGRLALMNFKAGTITINYKEDGIETITNADGSKTTKIIRVAKSIILNLTGNTVSLMSNDLSNANAYATAANNPNRTTGDEKLYLKGGEGSMAILDLFDKTDVLGYDANGVLTGPNLVPDQLDELRRIDPVTGKKLLINEANLVFHVDGNGPLMVENKQIAKRVYLYDLTNQTTVVDYLFDGTTGTNAKNGLLIYSGLLNSTKADDYTYKIRITNHIKSLVKNIDSTNVKLGVVVTEDINNSAMNKLRSSLTLPNGTIVSKAPQASVMSPLGVVLFGGTASVPEAKKLKLEIYYTKPN